MGLVLPGEWRRWYPARHAIVRQYASSDGDSNPNNQVRQFS